MEMHDRPHGDFTPEANSVITTAYKEGYDAGKRSERERCAGIAESVSGAWEQCGAQIAETIRREPS